MYYYLQVYSTISRSVRSMTSLFLHVSRLTTVGLMDEESDRHRTFNYRKQHKHTHTKKKNNANIHA